MIVRQSTEENNEFFISLTLEEYELLRSCETYVPRGLPETLKQIIDTGIHGDRYIGED